MLFKKWEEQVHSPIKVVLFVQLMLCSFSVPLPTRDRSPPNLFYYQHTVKRKGSQNINTNQTQSRLTKLHFSLDELEKPTGSSTGKEKVPIYKTDSFSQYCITMDTAGIVTCGALWDIWKLNQNVSVY